MDNTNIKSLDNLKLNEVGKVLRVFHSNFNLLKRLLDMGLTKNVFVKITKLAPFKNPVSVAFRGYEIVLRKQDIKNIIVEVIK